MLTELTGVVLCRDAALCSKESEDEVRRWREERKRNYPTTSNVKRKVAVSSLFLLLLWSSVDSRLHCPVLYPDPEICFCIYHLGAVYLCAGRR
jgi:hypothetical protein